MRRGLRRWGPKQWCIWDHACPAWRVAKDGLPAHGYRWQPKARGDAWWNHREDLFLRYPLSRQRFRRHSYGERRILRAGWRYRMRRVGW